MAGKKTPRQFVIDEDTIRQLQEIKHVTGASSSGTIRTAVREFHGLVMGLKPDSVRVPMVGKVIDGGRVILDGDLVGNDQERE